MTSPSTVKVAHTENGYLVRLEGRGTMRESPLVHQLAVDSLAGKDAVFVLDLSACDYLDSTFLGCLIDLQKRCSHAFGTLIIAAPSARCRQCLHTTGLDRLLTITEEPPAPVSELAVIPASALESHDLGRHILHCHRRLCEVDERNRAIFGPIVERLAQELNASHQ